jgi:hypothetical protein
VANPRESWGWGRGDVVEIGKIRRRQTKIFGHGEGDGLELSVDVHFIGTSVETRHFSFSLKR